MSANEPNDLRVVSMTRSGGQLTLVVSVPRRLLSVASAPGGLTMEGPSGNALVPKVTALTPAETAVAIVMHTAGAPPESAALVVGTTAELIRSLDPGIAVSLVTTTGALMVPLTLDRGAALAALAAPIPEAPVALTTAFAAAAGQLVGGRYVDPLVIVVDAGAPNDPGAATPGVVPVVAGMGVRIIPVAATASPLATQLAQRLGVAVPAGADPVALVDDAVGWMTGRLSVIVADPGAGTVTLRVRGGTADLAVPIPLSPAAVPTTTIAPLLATTTVPIVLAEQSTPPVSVAVAVAPPAVPTKSSSTRWMVVLAVAVAVAVVGVGGGAVVIGRRRSYAKSDEHTEPPPRPVRTVIAAPAAPTFHYTDLSDPLPSARVKAGPRRAIVARTGPSAKVPAPEPSVAAPVEPELEAPDDGSMSLSEAARAYDRRVRVLKLAEELGNVSEACRIVGVSRRSFYEWKRIADAHGLEALRPEGGQPLNG